MSTSLSSLERQKLAIWFRMLQFINRSNSHSNEFLKSYGLTVNQFDMLNQILLHQPLTQKALAEHLIVSKGGVSQMVKKLEEHGWVTRQRQAKQKYLSLTESGSALMARCQTVQAKYQASMFDSLSEEETEIMHTLFKKLNKQLKEKELSQNAN